MSFFISQIPALIVSVPLFCAPLCTISNHKYFSWLIALLATFFCFVCSIFLFFNIHENMVISYAMGQWLAPWGIEFRIDKLNSFLILIVSFFSLYACFFGLRSLKNDIEESKISLFWTSYLLCITGLLGVLITGDAFNIFVFLEISSLATYIIIGLGRDKKALYASFQYLILGTMGATFIVIAIGLLYVTTGTLNLFDLSFRVKNIVDNPALITAIAFLFVGISLKAAIFPLHTWLPNAYSYSPNVTTIFLSATATKVAIYLFFRFGYDIFGPSDIISTLSIGKIIIFFSLLAILFGSIAAYKQSNIKKMFAYSSVAQIGFITLGIGLMNSSALTGSISYMFAHALTKGTIFVLIATLIFSLKDIDIKSISGLVKTQPLIAFLFLISLLSLIGFPGTVGFISKWYLILGALQYKNILVIVFVAISSLLTIAYVWKISKLIFLSEPIKQNFNIPITMKFSCILGSVLIITFGIFPGFLINNANEISSILMSR